MKQYYGHLRHNRDSLIIKFFGLHKIKLRIKERLSDPEICFVVMSNVFESCKEIEEKYDLKGSLYGRKRKGVKYCYKIRVFLFFTYLLQKGWNNEGFGFYLEQVKNWNKEGRI